MHSKENEENPENAKKYGLYQCAKNLEQEFNPFLLTFRCFTNYMKSVHNHKPYNKQKLLVIWFVEVSTLLLQRQNYR
jgi:hypothetical protein